MKTYGVVLCAATLLAGCTVREVRVEEQPPLYREDVVAVPAPPPPQPEQIVVVPTAPPTPVVAIRQAPPQPYAERIPPSPGRDYVWVPGYWVVDRERNRWVWVSGRYERPPHRNAVWVQPRWERHGEDFRFSMGFWK